MGLVHFIQRPDVRAQLDRLLWPRKPKRLRPPRVPRRVGSERTSLIGTALDYAMRIELGRLLPFAIETTWVAEHAARYTPFLTEQATWSALVDRYFSAFAVARAHRRLRVVTEKDWRTLALASLNLASLDPIFRYWVFLPELVKERFSELDVQEVVDCLSICPWNKFIGHDRLLLNPNFGTFASRVGGADADIISGDRLIDIKCVDRASFGIGLRRQLLGYFLLSENVADAGFRPRVDRLSVYFARHGFFWNIPASRIRENPAFDFVKRWFRERTCARTGGVCGDETMTANEFVNRRSILIRGAESARINSHERDVSSLETMERDAAPFLAFLRARHLLDGRTVTRSGGIAVEISPVGTLSVWTPSLGADATVVPSHRQRLAACELSPESLRSFAWRFGVRWGAGVSFAGGRERRFEWLDLPEGTRLRRQRYAAFE